MTPEERKQKKREVAKIRLAHPLFQALTASKYGTWERFGPLTEEVKRLGLESYVRNDAAKELVLPRLMNDQSLVDEAYSMFTSSLTDITLGDYFALTGNTVKEEHKDTFVSKVAKKERDQMVDAYLEALTGNMAEMVLRARSSQKLAPHVRKYCEQPSSDSE